MATATTNFGLTKPEVNSATDEDLWGNELNTDLDGIDGLMKTALSWGANGQTTSFNVTAPATGTTVTASAKVLYLCDATAADITVSLPAASTAAGLTVGFKKTDASAHVITLDGNGSETIDGLTTQAISVRYGCLILECDGTGWNILNPSFSADQPEWVAAGGSANVITATYAPAITTLTDGLLLGFRASTANTTTTPTFSPNGLTAHTIVQSGGSALAAGNIAGANAEYLVRYNLANTRWELLNPTPIIPVATLIRSGLTPSTGSGASNTATFGTPFPTSCTSVVLTHTVIAGGTPSAVTAVTVNGFTFTNASGGAQQLYYIATGT